MGPSLDDLLLFERVARARSFTRAAHELRLARSTVSDRVRRLEEDLGVRLLHRSTRSVGLTADGQALLDRVSPILVDAREAVAAVRGQHDRPSGRLRITCPRLFGYAFLGPLVAEALDRWPELQVEVHLAERAVDLVEEGFDLAIRIGTLPDSSLVVRRLGSATMAYVASPSLPQGEPGDLPLIGVSRGEPVAWPMVVDGTQVRVPISPRLHVNSLIMARDAALAGVGVAFLPRFLAAEALTRGLLEARWPDRAPPAMPVNALYPSSRQLSARVRVFLDLLVERTRASPPWG